MDELVSFLDSNLVNPNPKALESATDAQISHIVFEVAFARTGFGSEMENLRSRLGPSELIPERVFHDALDRFDSLMEKMLEKPSEGLIRWAMMSNGASLTEMLKASRSFSRDNYFTPALLSALRRRQSQLRHNLRYVRLLAVRMNWTDLTSRVSQAQDGRKIRDAGTAQDSSAPRYFADSRSNRGRSKTVRAAVLFFFFVIFVFALNRVFGITGG
jgi:hypothetical protein